MEYKKCKYCGKMTNNIISEFCDDTCKKLYTDLKKYNREHENNKDKEDITFRGQIKTFNEQFELFKKDINMNNGTSPNNGISRIRFNKINAKEYIPFLGGRPMCDGEIRIKIINNDDLTNLLIAMNTAKSLDDFLKQV